MDIEKKIKDLQIGVSKVLSLTGRGSPPWKGGKK
jgi:hypothetical protein